MHPTRLAGTLLAMLFVAAAANAGIDEGQAIYERDCLRCHGDTGMGDGPFGIGLTVTDFTMGPFLFDDQSLEVTETAEFFKDVVRQGSLPFMGTGFMLSQLQLSPREVVDVVGYMMFAFHPCPLCSMDFVNSGKQKAKLGDDGKGVLVEDDWEVRFDEDTFHAMSPDLDELNGTYALRDGSLRKFDLFLDADSLQYLFDSAAILAEIAGLKNVGDVEERALFQPVFKVKKSLKKARIRSVIKIRVPHDAGEATGKHIFNVIGPLDELQD